MPAAPSYIIPFGKHRGERLEDVPEEYIAWLIERQRSTIEMYEKELDRRRLVEESSMSVVEQIVSAGYKTLAKKLHPDHGGSPDQFRALAAAKEQLGIILEEVKNVTS